MSWRNFFVGAVCQPGYFPSDGRDLRISAATAGKVPSHRPKAVTMAIRGRPMARLFVLAGTLVAAGATPALPRPNSPKSVPPASALPNATPQARLDSLRPPEVRLRKLHLVRPDLIPYPLAYEVVC